MRRTLVLLVLVASFFVSGSALAQPRTHTGLMLRFGAGFGADIAGDGGELNGQDVVATIGGPSGALTAAVGGYVTPNIAINGELWASFTPNPTATVEIGGFEASEDLEGTMAFFAAGAGLTFWIDAIDLFIAPTLGFGKATFSDDDVDTDDLDTDWGFAGKVMVGKQWWVGADWGLGVSGQLTVASLQDDDSDESAAFVAFHVLFSATFH